MLMSVKSMTSLGISVGLLSNPTVGKTFCAIRTLATSLTTAPSMASQISSDHSTPFSLLLISSFS